MNAPDILARCHARCVTLHLTATGLKMAGPAEAVEDLRPAVIAAKPQILAYFRELVDGALLHEGGGYYLPWGPYLSAAELERMRGELLESIEELSRIEGWDQGTLDDIAGRAMRSPLSDLLPNLHHFAERLRKVREKAK